MEYNELNDQRFSRPTSSFHEYEASSEKAIQDFLAGNKIISLIEKNEFSINQYHGLLLGIFHQVYFSSTSFAFAGAMVSNISTNARAYLMHHAEEEKDHWQWILQDLKSTGYKGADPRSTHANWAAQAYLSYGVYLALFNPLARLAMANVLEGVSGKFGLMYGAKALQSLKIGKDQAKFFLAHGELDQGHTQDILEVLKRENLTGEQWGEMVATVQNTSQLYKNIYNLSVKE